MVKHISSMIGVVVGLGLLASSVEAQECELDVPLTNPTSRFQINSDATVTDRNSQRTWLRCPLSLALDDRGTPNAIDDLCVAGEEDAQLNVEEAIARVNALNQANHNGSNQWRLANFDEMQSITERACQNPAVNLAVFPSIAFNLILTSTISDRGYPMGFATNDGESLDLAGTRGELNSKVGVFRVLRD